MKLSQLAAETGADLRNLRDDFDIRGITTLDAAREGDVSFLTDSAFLAAAEASHASAFICPPDIAITGRTTLHHAEPWAPIVRLLNALHPPLDGFPYEGIHPLACVDNTATIGEGCRIAPFAVVGPDCELGPRTVLAPGVVLGRAVRTGAGCIIHPNAVLYDDTQLGDRVIVHGGAVIGADGFKYEMIAGRLTKVPQVGRVVIGNDVEIGANSTIDRASFTVTRVGEGTKIDNLVQIGHNADIGPWCILVGQAGVAGSAQLGAGCILAGQAGVADHTILAPGTQVAGNSSLKDNTTPGQRMAGIPAMPLMEYARMHHAQTRLPELLRTVRTLERKVEALEKKLAGG